MMSIGNNRNCGCVDEPVSSWITLQKAPPANPLDLIAMARIDDSMSNQDIAVYLNSDTFSTPPTSWYPAGTPFLFNGNPYATSLRSDQQGTVANAIQWNMSHLTRNSDANLAPPLRNLIFLRGGLEWENHIPLTIGASTSADLQLSYRDNAATRGDYAGTIPVLSFTARAYTGALTLAVTVKAKSAHTFMAIRMIDGSGNWTMFDMEWIIVP